MLFREIPDVLSPFQGMKDVPVPHPKCSSPSKKCCLIFAFSNTPSLMLRLAVVAEYVRLEHDGALRKLIYLLRWTHIHETVACTEAVEAACWARTLHASARRTALLPREGKSPATHHVPLMPSLSQTGNRGGVGATAVHTCLTVQFDPVLVSNL